MPQVAPSVYLSAVGWDTTELFDFDEFTINPEEVRILGDRAYSHGLYGFSMTPKAGGDTIELSGKFLTILEKQADGSSEEQEKKTEKEREAIEELNEKLKDNEILELWKEYEKGESPEAKFVYELDKIEMLLQAYEYEKEHGTNLQDFWNMSKDKIKNSELKKLCEFIFKKRN